jgi:two-component system, NtrC family, response regulator AtoC
MCNMQRPLDSPFVDEADRLHGWLQQVGHVPAFAFLLQQCKDLVVFTFDREQRLAFWNQAAERCFDRPASRVLGLDTNQLASVLRCPAIAALDLTTGSTVECIVQTSTGGQPRDLSLVSRGFVDNAGHLLGGLSLMSPTPITLPVPTVDPITAATDLPFFGLISRDPSMLQAVQIIRNVAETDSTVLVRGESGTGKEIVARALHALSERRNGPFLAVNCAALTPSLLESELFGHVRGAFTGAIKDHPGLFKRADGGTVFLDEVAELSLDLQAKLLRVLQERAFIPVGGDKAIHVDVRIVSATHRSLREEVKAGRFRDDLMYRLRVVPIFLPPLRERRGDVGLLLRYFIQKHNAVGPRQVLTVAPEAMRQLLDHAWPGNVRELQNVIEYAFAVGRGPELLLDELPPEFRESRIPQTRNLTPSDRSIDEAERIRRALADCNGNIEAAAQRLGINRSTLWRKRRRYAI